MKDQSSGHIELLRDLLAVATRHSRTEEMAALKAAIAALSQPAADADADWASAYAAFVGAFDTPAARRQNSNEYANDARDRLRSFNDSIVHGSRKVGEPADSDRIADLEDQVEELQRAAEIVAEEYEKDCGKALRGLVSLVPDVDWTDGLTAYNQADIVREHIHEVASASSKAAPVLVVDEAMEKRALALFSQEEQNREYNPRVIRRILTAAIAP